jgi:hypothetical protein
MAGQACGEMGDRALVRLLGMGRSGASGVVGVRSGLLWNWRSWRDFSFSGIIRFGSVSQSNGDCLD